MPVATFTLTLTCHKRTDWPIRSRIVGNPEAILDGPPAGCQLGSRSRQPFKSDLGMLLLVQVLVTRPTRDVTERPEDGSWGHSYS